MPSPQDSESDPLSPLLPQTQDSRPHAWASRGSLDVQPEVPTSLTPNPVHLGQRPPPSSVSPGVGQTDDAGHCTPGLCPYSSEYLAITSESKENCTGVQVAE